jgi:hypothetical protein
MSLNTDIKHVAIHAKDEILKLRRVTQQKEEQVAAKLRSAVEDRDYAKERAQSFSTVLLETLSATRMLEEEKARLSNDAQEDIAKKIRAEEILGKYADKKAIAYASAEIEANRRVSDLEKELRILREENQKERDRLLVPALASVRGVYRRYREEYMRETDRIVAKHDSILADFKKLAADRLAEYDGVMADYEKRLTEAIQSDAPLMEFQFPIPETRSAVPELSMENPVFAGIAADGVAAAVHVFASAEKSRQRQNLVAEEEEEEVVIVEDADNQPGDSGRKRARESAKRALDHAREKADEEVPSPISVKRGEQERLEKRFHPGDAIGIFATRCMAIGFFDAVKIDGWWTRRHGSRFDEVISKFAVGKPDFAIKFRGLVEQRFGGNVPMKVISDRAAKGAETCWICESFTQCDKTICLFGGTAKERFPVDNACAQFVECLDEFLSLLRRYAHPTNRPSLMDTRVERVNILVKRLFHSAFITPPSASKPSVTKRAKTAQAKADAEHVVQVPKSKK